MGPNKRVKSSREAQFDKDGYPVAVSFSQGKGLPIIGLFYHSELEFQFIRQGRVEYFVDTKNYQLERNSVLIIHRNEVHNYIPDPQSCVSKISLVFSPDIIMEKPTTAAILRELRSHHLVVLSERQATSVEFLMQEIADECRMQEPFWLELVPSNIQKFLAILHRAISNPVPVSSKDNPVIKNVLRYLEHNFTEKTSLAEVASRFCMSSCFLSRMFKSYVGLGFREYLIHKRVAEAKRLLEETDMKIITVAAEVGFHNLSTFNRDFRMLTGIRPSDYRKVSSQADKMP